jgi:hypothetical protein
MPNDEDLHRNFFFIRHSVFFFTGIPRSYIAQDMKRRITLTTFLGLLNLIASAQESPLPPSRRALPTGEIPARDTAASAPTKGAIGGNAKADLEDFLRTRAELLQEMHTVRKNSGNDTPSRMRALGKWQKENGARVEAMQREASRLATVVAPVAIPPSFTVTIPGDATAEMEGFLVERARLFNERAALENRGGSPAKTAQDVQEWHEKNVGRFAMQNQRARVLAEQSQSRPNPFPVPAMPQIPRDATAELRALLMERHTLLRERAEMEKQNSRLAPAAQAEAVARWQKEASARFQGLAEKARAISDNN